MEGERDIKLRSPFFHNRWVKPNTWSTTTWLLVYPNGPRQPVHVSGMQQCFKLILTEGQWLQIIKKISERGRLLQSEGEGGRGEWHDQVKSDILFQLNTNDKCNLK